MTTFPRPPRCAAAPPAALLRALALMLLLCAAPAAAKTLTFRATLGGTAPPTVTGSPANGRATIRVDTSTRRVSIDLDMNGITRDQLSRAWQAAPRGPVALHEYRGPDDWDAVVGAPWGAAYRATRTGFQLTLRDLDVVAAAKALNAPIDFDGFVNGLRAGRIVVVVHTERFAAGEVSGRTLAN